MATAFALRIRPDFLAGARPWRSSPKQLLLSLTLQIRSRHSLRSLRAPAPVVAASVLDDDPPPSSALGPLTLGCSSRLWHCASATSTIILPKDRTRRSFLAPSQAPPSMASAPPSAAACMEPSPKMAKLDHHAPASSNGSPHVTSLFVKKLSANAVIPSRASALAAGYDISSAYDDVVPARGKALIKTDLSIAIPDGTYARLAPRSGLAWKHSIDVGAGVIDADYRGPVGVILFNHSDHDFPIKAGDRVAQLILEKIVTPEVVEVEDLEATVRGENGFGSTGVAAST